MLKRAMALLPALALLALAACGLLGREVEVYRAVQPYYLQGGSAVEAEPVSVDPALGEIDAALEAFNSGTTDAELLRALPEGVDALGWELSGGELRLEVSPEYAAVTGYWRTAGDCCITLTFCAIEGVERVSVWAAGTQLSAAMSPGDFVLADASGLDG